MIRNRGGSGYAWATPPPTGTGMSVGGGLSGEELSGWVMDENGGLKDCGPKECGAASKTLETSPAFQSALIKFNLSAWRLVSSFPSK